MSEEISIFDALPGERLPVSKVMDTLSTMWQVPYEEGREAPSGFRASQMNLVVHFGLQTTVDEALNTFNSTIQFAQRYPCRLIVLCPRGREVSDALLEAKLFAQCYIGETMRDMCCCEVLMLGYPTRVAGFLENQVSIWLESDLPTYYWFFKVPAQRIAENYFSFIHRCRRVIYDSSIEGEAYADIPWEHPHTVRDLAHARLLPVRQSLGQFFSSYSPQVLLAGLAKVEIRYGARRLGEARSMVAWLQQCLNDCAQQADVPFAVEFPWQEGEVEGNYCLELNWVYTNSNQFFKWEFCVDKHTATMRADFGSGLIEVTAQVHLLSDEKALAEALFFA